MAMTLIVLAATMGNKYGGLKQLEGIGPNGETILDFSIYDAVRVGFNKIVFVISRHFEQEFKKTGIRQIRTCGRSGVCLSGCGNDS